MYPNSFNQRFNENTLENDAYNPAQIMITLYTVRVFLYEKWHDVHPKSKLDFPNAFNLIKAIYS